MEFRILGPFEVEHDGRTTPLAGAKQRALLVLLLLDRGRAVPTDRLIEEIWNGEPPATALKSVQVYVSQLRKVLGAERVATREGGYELLVARGEVDADRFEELVGAASGAPPEQGAAQLREALALFRGRPLGDFGLEPWAQPEIARLEERQLSALEARIDADLALNHHNELIPELQVLVDANPYREHLLEQLVLALYRSGRQADALATYRRGAARLRDELGLEPGRGLRMLEQAILRQDPELDPPPPRRNGRRGNGWKLVVFGAGALLAAAVAAFAVALTRSSDASLASVPPGVAIIDVANGRLVAHIPWHDLRWPVLGFTGNSSFWVWTLDGNSLVRIDPDDGRVLSRISSPLGADTQWAMVDRRSIWFSGPRLVRMDIASGTEANRFALTTDPRSDGLAEFARGAGSFWVARQQAGELLRVDARTGQVQRRFTGMTSPFAVRFGDGGAWVVNFNSVSRVDAATETVTQTSLPPPVAEMTVGGGFAWVSNEAKGAVYKIDRSGQIVATYETGEGARDMAYADGTVWVANQDVGTVTGIDAASGELRTFQFGHSLQTVAALGGKVLVSVNEGPTPEGRIDALKGAGARLISPAYEFDHPDPAIGGNGKVHAFIFQAERATCAPLLGYPDAPAPRGQHLVPELAASMPTLSANRRTYTFTVRRGFRFAPPSNAPVDARTVRFSVERALSPRLGPRAPGIGFLSDLMGARAFHAGRAAHVAGLRVRGNRISFTLTRPSPDFLERLAVPYFCPVPRDTLLKPNGVGVYTGPAPPGAGPYTFSGLVWNGEVSILKRNPNYGGTRPQLLDWIAFREGVDTENAVGRIERGRFDAIEHYDPLLAPRGEVARRFASTDLPGNPTYRAFPARVTHFVALDAGRPPFSDTRLRRAVAAALERASLAAFWNETPTDRLLPPAVRGAGPSHLTVPSSTVRRVRERPKVIVGMAVQAGDDRGLDFVDVVRADLAQIGVSVRPVMVTDVGAALRDHRGPIRLAALSTSLDYPDPASFLTRMLGTDVPSSWLPTTTRRAVAHLAELSGAKRDRAAVLLAAHLASRDVPVVAFSTQELGALVGPRLGCRMWNGVDPALDLAALCFKKS